MSVEITIRIDVTEINALDTAIKAYWNHKEDWHEGIDESPCMINAISKIHDAYLRAYELMRRTTPIYGDYIVTRRDKNGDVESSRFVEERDTWVQSVLNDNNVYFTRLFITPADYAEWQLMKVDDV